MKEMDAQGVKIEFLGHAGFLLTDGKGKRIAIDPYLVSEGVGKADAILITHSHYDHCSIQDITKLAKEGAVVVISPDAQSKVTRVEGVQMQIIEVGDSLTLGTVKIETLPAYNVNKEFHPKSEGWLGYVIKLENVVIYHAGDTDKIPEMEKLTGYGKQGNFFIALLPVSGTYVMTAEEAADAASLINPSLAIPMHYGAGVAGTRDDAERFVQRCSELGVNAKILEKVP